MIVYKFQLQDRMQTLLTLHVYVNSKYVVEYELVNRLSLESVWLSNIDAKKENPLPTVVLDYKSVEEMADDIILAIEGGALQVLTTKCYVKTCNEINSYIRD